MKEKKHICKVCKKEIHKLRVKLGYTDTCVEHSTSQKYTGIISSVGNTETYEMQIIKDPELAKRMVNLANSRYSD
jgi:hypothetical protein